MEKIVIIGGGIIGMTLANYLDTTKYQVTVVERNGVNMGIHKNVFNVTYCGILGRRSRLWPLQQLLR